MGKRPTVDKAIEAVRAKKGFVSHAANLLKISRKTLHAMINDHPTLKDALEEEREARTDMVEGKLLEQILAGNVTAIIFYLKTQAKDRNYVERQEVVGKDGGEILLKVYGNREAEDI